MFNQLNINEKVSILLASLVLAIPVFLFSFHLPITQQYSDFIVGNIAWSASTKYQDLIALPVLIFSSFAVVILLNSIFNTQKILHGLESTTEFANQLIWWSLPSVAVIFGLITGGTMDVTFFYISTFGITFIAIAAAVNTFKRENINYQALGISALAILFIALIPLEFALVFGRISTSAIKEINLSFYTQMTYTIAVTGGVLGLLYAIINSKHLALQLPKFLLIGQIGLLTIFLTLYPAKLLTPIGIYEYDTTIWLKVLIALIMLWGMFDVIHRFMKYTTPSDLTNLLSPTAVFALMVGLKFGNTIAPSISPDDYHFGEKLLGWWSYTYGATPYVDYIPAHGLIGDYLAQFFSAIFYDGYAGSVYEAGRLGGVILAFTAFISMYHFSRSVGLAFITFFLGGQTFIVFYFLAMFYGIWFNRSLMQIPSKWLTIWLLTSPLLILGVPAQGLLLFTASGVMATYCIWHVWNYPTERDWVSIGLAIATLIITSLITPIWSMLQGAIIYVLENAPINQLAYGVLWSPNLTIAAKSGLLFETMRMSWSIIVFICLLLIYINAKNINRNKHELISAIAVLLFILLIIPYSMGRIDPGNISRSGPVAIFSWTVLLPIAMWHVLNSNSRLLLILSITCVSAMFKIAPLYSSSFIAAMSPSIASPPLQDGNSIGLNNIGKAFVKEQHWNRLSRLNKLLNAKLARGETYLDLTSRNAQYFYLNRKPPVPITAPYNMAPLSQQKYAVEKLAHDLPKLALLEGINIIHDGGGLALRNPYLYRFVLENYEPVSEDGFVIGYRKEKFSTNQTNSANKYSVIESPNLRTFQLPNPLKIDNLEYKLSLLEKAFSQHNLQKIPIAWGQSIALLEQKMTLVKSINEIAPKLDQLIPSVQGYKVIGNNPQLSFYFTDKSFSGREAGLIKFDFFCYNQVAEPSMQIFWWGDANKKPVGSSSVRFIAQNGTLIVPVDISPRWLMLNKINGIRIDLNSVSACSAFSIKNIGLFQRLF